jgi:hypothetical protein
MNKLLIKKLIYNLVFSYTYNILFYIKNQLDSELFLNKKTRPVFFRFFLNRNKFFNIYNLEKDLIK